MLSKRYNFYQNQSNLKGFWCMNCDVKYLQESDISKKEGSNFMILCRCPIIEVCLYFDLF